MRKALDENEDSPVTGSNIETTQSYSTALATTSTTSITTTTTTTPPSPPSTTTTTTTTTTTQPPTTFSSTSKSTTSTTQRTTKRYALWKNSDDAPKTPKTYFSNSFYHPNSNKNPNNLNGQTYTKSPLKTVTTKRDSDQSSTPTKPAITTPTINPFYYGFNRLPRYSTTPRSNTHYTTTSHKHSLSTITTRTTPYQFHHYFFTSTKKSDLLAPTNDEVDDNSYHENASQSDDTAEVEKPRSSTYNPVFDIYFKQIARQRTAVPKINK